MLRICYKANGSPDFSLTPEKIKGVLNASQGLLWVDIQNPEEDELSGILRDIFHFHPLAIEDCQSTGFQTAKIDDYRDYLFIIAHALKIKPGSGVLETDELNLFIGQNYVVSTHHNGKSNPVEHVWSLLEKDDRLLSNGPGFLAHAILDILVDGYMPLIDSMDEEIEWLEDKVLQQPSPETLERILDLKHSTLTLRRLIGPQREVMNILSRDDFPQISQHNKIYFRDIYDHLVRIQDLSESVRDIVQGTLDIYLSATSNRLNEVMKALTIVSTIFLPLTFLAGVYGMNFITFPEIHWRYGYLAAWVLFILIAILMVVYFKKKRWL